MTQGLEDEASILKMYEEKLCCKAMDSGSVISQSHPFLGASPDGEVDGVWWRSREYFPMGFHSKRQCVVVVSVNIAVMG